MAAPVWFRLVCCQTWLGGRQLGEDPRRPRPPSSARHLPESANENSTIPIEKKKQGRDGQTSAVVVTTVVSSIATLPFTCTSVVSVTSTFGVSISISWTWTHSCCSTTLWLSSGLASNSSSCMKWKLPPEAANDGGKPPTGMSGVGALSDSSIDWC